MGYTEDLLSNSSLFPRLGEEAQVSSTNEPSDVECQETEVTTESEPRRENGSQHEEFNEATVSDSERSQTLPRSRSDTDYAGYSDRGTGRPGLQGCIYVTSLIVPVGHERFNLMTFSTAVFIHSFTMFCYATVATHQPGNSPNPHL